MVGSDTRAGCTSDCSETYVTSPARETRAASRCDGDCWRRIAANLLPENNANHPLHIRESTSSCKRAEMSFCEQGTLFCVYRNTPTVTTKTQQWSKAVTTKRSCVKFPERKQYNIDTFLGYFLCGGGGGQRNNSSTVNVSKDINTC